MKIYAKFGVLEPAILQGKNLKGYLSGKKKKDPDACAYTVSYGGRDATLRTERWRYTRWDENIGQGNEELYDHKNDPEEFENLAGNLDYQDVLNEMRNKFEMARKESKNGLK